VTKNKFIDRVEQLSKKGINYPIGIKHHGKIGRHLENILVENPHTKNESDMINLELKTKYIKKQNVIGLANYSNAEDCFNRTINKIKKGLALVTYDVIKNKIYLKSLTMFSKFSMKDFSLYMNPYYGTKVDHKINIKDLYKVYKKTTTYNLGEEV
tara:strand:- start:44 stop:508 length:465 start_codon:yes stop_codon:yes gene_type:complete